MDGKKCTLTTQVHDAILEMIINAGSGTDQMLLTEGMLVEKFGTSKAPVREALLRLCAEEVLTSIPRCGYVVVRVGEKSGHDNLAVRDMLETSSLEVYFDAFTPEKMEEIRLMLAEDRARMPGKTNVWTIWQSNVDFHCKLISVSGNEVLYKHLRQCIEVERRFYAQNQWCETRMFESEFHPEGHENIWRAILEKDKAKAIDLLHRDIMGNSGKEIYA